MDAAVSFWHGVDADVICARSTVYALWPFAGRYDTGDDEMKRTIAKAWTEGREKRDGDKLGGL
jgi:hypothetical protein